MSIEISERPPQPLTQTTELPRGLLKPSPRVQEAVAREMARLREILHADVAPEAQKRFLEEMILHDHFDPWPGIEVAYRSVPEGIEIVAAGWAETLELRQQMPLEEQFTIQLRVI